MDPSHIYSHELGHAIDGWDHRHSTSKRWWAIWRKEILRGGALSRYATVNPGEGFAEFARLLYANNTVPLAVVEQRLPLASQYFKEHGLWTRNRV